MFSFSDADADILMPFKKLGGFLDRFSSFLFSQSDIEEKASEILKEFVPGKKFTAKIERDTLVIFSEAAVQSEIFLRRELILETLRRSLGGRSPERISFRQL